MVSIAETKKDFLELILKKGSLKIAGDVNNLFVLKSGRKSPHFINIGALTDGEALIGMKKAYAHFIFHLLKEGKIDRFDFIFGPSYKGINISCLACEGLAELGVNVRYLYDRKEVKDYGDKAADHVIVGAGYFVPGSRILLIDDVVTTADTKFDAVSKLKILGEHKVVGMVLAVDRQEKMGDSVNIEEYSALENFERQTGIRTFSILTMEDIFNQVKDSLTSDVRKTLVDYYDNYGAIKLS